MGTWVRVTVAALGAGALVGCCPMIAYLGETRLVLPSEIARDARSIDLRLCEEGATCEEPVRIVLERVAFRTFVEADCDEPERCVGYALESGALTVPIERVESVEFTLEIGRADGEPWSASGTTRIETRRAGSFPCRQTVPDSVIDLA